MDEEQVYALWMQQAVRPGWPHAGQLLRRFGSARGVFEASTEELADAGVTGAALKALSRRSLKAAEKQLQEAQKRGWTVITPGDPSYPEPWSALPDLPLVLYATAPLPSGWQERPSVTLLATRQISTDGRQLIASMAAGLAAAGVTVVGDTIAGGDEAAMKAVASLSGRGVVIQPCGLDVSYPQKTQELREQLVAAGGWILSEFPAGTVVRRENFLLRNRLVATLSSAVVVTEAPLGSGTLKVAGQASAAGHDVMAVPGDRTLCAGCHRLIRDGALLVQSSAEVVLALSSLYPGLDAEKAAKAERVYLQQLQEEARTPAPAPHLAKRREKRVIVTSTAPASPAEAESPAPLPADWPTDWSPATRRVAESLTLDPQSVEALTEATSLSYAQATMALTELELAGVAEGCPGGRYRRKG